MGKHIELQVNKFFFNQVSNKELKEDYRAIKPYWIKKLIKQKYQKLSPQEIVMLYFAKNIDVFIHYDILVFKNGYNEKAPIIKTKCSGIRFTESHEMTCMGQGIAFALEVQYVK